MWLRVKNTEIISKLFQCFISHMCTCTSKMKFLDRIFQKTARHTDKDKYKQVSKFIEIL